LRGPGARWGVVVGDRLSDLSNEVTFRFRGALRQITRSIEDDIEELKTAKQWDEVARRLQTEVAEAVTSAFVAISAGAQATADAVIELLAQEAAELPRLTARDVPIDVRDLWTDKRLDPRGSKGGQA